jgi:RNA polymerase sigma factor (sigma-70 family)
MVCPFFWATGNNRRVNERTDSKLLHDYVERRCESAFAELVNRHVGLVYSVARRAVVDEHLAQDVTQTTFTILARQAQHLAARAPLSSWLHRTALNQAAKLVRSEMRRRAREQEAYAMQTMPIESDSDWKRIAPKLDAALDKLAEADRAAILLRYFERKSAKEIGDALQISEEAAQKRVTRALERLRGLLVGRESALTTASLAALIATQAVVAAPLGLSTSVSAAALAGGAIAGGTAINTLELILMSKLKISAASALVVAVVATPLVLQHQMVARLRSENSVLQGQAQRIDGLRGEIARLSAQLSDARQASATSTDPSELLRLRGQMGRMRALESEAAKLRKESLQYQSQARKAMEDLAATQQGTLEFAVQRVNSIDALKQVGQQLHALAAANNLGAAFTADGRLNPNLIAGSHPNFDLGNVQIVVSDPSQLPNLLQEGSDAIVARTAEAIQTPDERWMRFYIQADGSVQSYSTPFSNQVFSANWQLEQFNP